MPLRCHGSLSMTRVVMATGVVDHMEFATLPITRARRWAGGRAGSRSSAGTERPGARLGWLGRDEAG